MHIKSRNNPAQCMIACLHVKSEAHRVLHRLQVSASCWTTVSSLQVREILQHLLSTCTLFDVLLNTCHNFFPVRVFTHLSLTHSALLLLASAVLPVAVQRPPSADLRLDDLLPPRPRSSPPSRPVTSQREGSARLCRSCSALSTKPGMLQTFLA